MASRHNILVCQNLLKELLFPFSHPTCSHMGTLWSDDLANRDYSFTLGGMNHCARWNCWLTMSLHPSTACGILPAANAAALSWFFFPSITSSSFLPFHIPAETMTASIGKHAKKTTCMYGSLSHDLPHIPRGPWAWRIFRARWRDSHEKCGCLCGPSFSFELHSPPGMLHKTVKAYLRQH